MMQLEEASYSIRWYQESDLKELVLLHNACLPGEGWRARDIVRFPMARERNNVFKVLAARDPGDPDDPGLPVGSLLYTLEEEACHVRRVCVRGDIRRRGWGRALLGHLIDPDGRCRKPLITARIDIRRIEAVRMFRAAGFVFAPGVEHYGDGLEGWRCSLARAAARRTVLAGSE